MHSNDVAMLNSTSRVFLLKW